LRTSENGSALLETAFILPIMLIISAGIFEFGRAYQTYEVVTNAAREGARVAILPNASTSDVNDRVNAYLNAGSLNSSSATVSVNQSATVTVGSGTATASTVTVSYPFSFVVLDPIARLINSGSNNFGSAFSLSSTAEMRNEAQ
jgi:Flp pilus assembly protein TadG